MIEQRITDLIDEKLKAGKTAGVVVDEIVAGLSLLEWQAFGRPLIEERVFYANSVAQVTKNYPHQVIPIHHHKVMVVNERSQQAERVTTQDAERKAVKMYRDATTLNQKIAAFVGLKQYRVSLGDGTEVPWHEATESQIGQRIGMLSGQITGIMTTRELLEGARRILRETGTSNLREAEAKSQKPVLVGATP